MTIKDLKEYIKDHYMDQMSVESLFYQLLKRKKVKFDDISQMYVKYLENLNSENQNNLHESAVCIYQMMDPLTKDNKDAIHRSLYAINKFGNIGKMKSFKDVVYDEEVGKEAFSRTYCLID